MRIRCGMSTYSGSHTTNDEKANATVFRERMVNPKAEDDDASRLIHTKHGSLATRINYAPAPAPAAHHLQYHKPSTSTISPSLSSALDLDMALRAAVEVTFSAASVRNGRVESVSAATAAPGGVSVRRCNVSSKCRVSHSLSTRRRAVVSVVRREGIVKMELKATATTASEADSLSNEEEGPIPTGPVDVSEHVAVLKRAAKTKKVPPTDVFAAIRAIEKAKLDPSNFLEYLGGTQSPGRTWMLVFSASKELVRDALNGGPGGGQYLPISAIQNLDAPAMRIENGVYLGPLGALAFEGRFSMKNRILAFLFDKLKIKIGILPAFTVNIGKKEDEGRVPGNSDPFFIFFYANDEIVVAKGRGGGLAFWCRCKRVSGKL